MERLQSKVQHLQQQLDVCKARNQDNLSKLQASECIVEHQSQDLDFLQHECQKYKDQLFYYEGVNKKQELELSQAQRRVDMLESSLDVYKKKYQASLGRAEELEGQVQQLAEELTSQDQERKEATLKLHADHLMLQEELKNKCLQANRAEDAIAQLAQKLRGVQEELAQEHRLTSQCEETIRDLRDQLAASRTQAIQKQDELLRKSQQEILNARSSLQEKGREVDQQRARAQQLEANLQRAQQELQQSQRECSSLRMEAEDLQQTLQESQEQQQQAAQELAQQKELVLLAQGSYSRVQEELRECVTEVLCHVQTGRQREAELQVLKDRASDAETELEQKSVLLEQLTEELRRSKQQHQAAAQEARQHQQKAAQLERALESSQEEIQRLQQQGLQSTLERLRADMSQWKLREQDLQHQLLLAKEHEAGLVQEGKGLKQQLQSSEHKLQEEQQNAQNLQAIIRERETENQILQEQLQQHAAWLELARKNLQHGQLQLQQQTAEARKQEAALAQLRSELHAAHEREQQSSHALAAAKNIAKELKWQVTSCQASQKEALEQLEQRVRQVSCLEADLQLSQHNKAHLEEELAACREQTKQLRSQFQTLKRQQEEEACSSEKRLGELDLQVQHWQHEHRVAEQALADKDEELVVLKVELAVLEEKWHAAAEERGQLQNEANLLRQKLVKAGREVDVLKASLEEAHSDSHHLHQDNERMVAQVGQWVTEQKQVNEKLGHKIRDQLKQIARLTGEKDYLQGLTESLQQENRQLRNEVDEQRIEQERLKARYSRHPCVGHRQLSPLLPGEERRQNKMPAFFSLLKPTVKACPTRH